MGDPTPKFPANVALAPPFPLQPAGAFVRLDAIVRRVRAAAAYTGETQAILQLAPRRASRTALHEMAPAITATALPGNRVQVAFIRGRASGLYIETNVDREGWQAADKIVVSPGVITVPRNEAETPRGVVIRARYLERNDPVGKWSNIATVQTIP